MSKLARYTQLLFGSNAGTAQIAKFGSYAASSPTTYSGATVTPTLIQSLSNYLTGWFGAIVGGGNPAIEDMNAICYLFAYQLVYLMQEGIAEWDSATIYFKGSLAQSTDGLGTLYISLTDNNTNNALSDTTNWRLQGSGNIVTVSTSTAIAASTGTLRSNSTSGALTQTLPPVASVAIGKRITIKDKGNGSFQTTVQGNGAELIDGINIYGTTLNQNESMTVENNGAGSWDVV